MLIKILDYEFNMGGLPIDRSGQNNHGQATATVFTTHASGLKAASFLSESSRITVPYNATWSTIGAARVDVRARLEALEHRTNLVEIERSLALFVRADGIVSFVYLAPTPAPTNGDDKADEPSDHDPFTTITALPPPTGSTDPSDTLVANPPFNWQGVNTSAEFAPDGQARTVPVGDYFTISAIHDGLASMRIAIDGELAGVRTDVRHAVPPLQAPGVVSIGAWPHDSRYTLHGSLDFVRIWRNDPEFEYRQFFCRPMSKEARDCWHALMCSMSKNMLDDEQRDTYLRLTKCIYELQLKLYRTIAKNGHGNLDQLQAFFRDYVKLWCGGRIHTEDMSDLMARWIAWLQEAAGPEFDNYLVGLLECLMRAKALGLCESAHDLRACDPDWAAFIDNLGKAVPNPLCPPRIYDPTDCKPN